MHKLVIVTSYTGCPKSSAPFEMAINSLKIEFNPAYSWELAQHIITFCYWYFAKIFEQYQCLIFKW